MILITIVVFSITLPLYYVYYAYSINKVNSFPIDDSWIHLQFAKNLVQYGSFSYFKNEIVTAGSTSPLYVLILSAGFTITKNEMVLSYLLGILFFALAAYYFYKTLDDSFGHENWLAITGSLLFVTDRWINLISVSGMETTLYLFMLIACYNYYHKGNPFILGACIGLAMWIRPDAAVFIIAIIFDYLVLVYVSKKSKLSYDNPGLFTRNQLIQIASTAGLLIISYFAMNLILSGSLLPNTYDAKISYYNPELETRRPHFLRYQVWEHFTESAYILLIIPFIFATIKIFYDLFKLKYNRNLAAVIFIFALIFIYWYKLPYSHRFGRYLIPIIPFYIMLFIYGSRIFFKWAAKYIKEKKTINAINIFLFAITVIYFCFAYYKNRIEYQDQASFIYKRQVEAAIWLKNNTPEGSVVATHDVGAIAYYSERKIVDIVGLINPEFSSRLHTPDFAAFMRRELKEQNVSHLAFLKEWFRVVNQPVLFQGGENNKEIMQVFKYDPDKTHILSAEVNSAVMYAEQSITDKDYKSALTILINAAKSDPKSSLTFYMLGTTYLLINDKLSSEKSLLKSIEIYPGYRDAVLALGNLYRAERRNEDAKQVVNKYLEIVPKDTAALSFINKLGDTQSLFK